MIKEKIIYNVLTTGACIFLGEQIQVWKSRKAYKKNGIKGLMLSVMDADDILNDENITVSERK